MSKLRVLADGKPGELSTDHAASSYGIPVLILEGAAYGAGDGSWRIEAADPWEDLTLLLAARGAGFRVVMPAEIRDPLSASTGKRGGKAQGGAKAEAARRNATAPRKDAWGEQDQLFAQDLSDDQIAEITGRTPAAVRRRRWVIKRRRQLQAGERPRFLDPSGD